MWPADPAQRPNCDPVDHRRRRRRSHTLGKAQLPAQIARWLDALDETGRWALLKLVTGALRIGVSARLAKTAAAALGDKDVTEIELIWPGLEPPYVDLFAWLEGRGDKPVKHRPGAVPPADAGARDRGAGFRRARSRRLHRRMEMGRHPRAGVGRRERTTASAIARLYSRTGEDISKSFPDLLEALRLRRRDRRRIADPARRPRAVLQRAAAAAQPQSRDAEAASTEFPAHLRAYDLLVDGGEDLRELPFARAARAAAKPSSRGSTIRASISRRWCRSRPGTNSTAARADPASAGAGDDAEAVEGVMLKRRDAPYVPGRPKGLWWKWKRDPFTVDAVLMYAQRGHGKRSSFYSDYTFGVWTRGDGGDELVPVGKAYFGFTDEELIEIDRFVRRNTVDRFGPVREVTHEAGQGPRAGSRVRGPAALDPAQIRRRHALSAHQPAALGQAAARGRPAGDAGEDAAKRSSEAAAMHGACKALPRD